jgi:glycosyltransferase involved in cell wall biosynthesis
MPMTRPLVVFLESYVAGGADRVVANLLGLLPCDRIELCINARADTAVLLAGPLPQHVRLRRYSWRTPAEGSAWTNRAGTALGRWLRRALVYAVRYPWLALLFVRCYLMLRAVRPRAIWVSNGGYPGGDICRLATIAGGLLPGCVVIHMVHSVAQAPRRPLRLLEYWIDRRLDRAAQLVAVSRAVAASLPAHRALRQDIQVIYNGLPVREEPPPPAASGTLRLLQVGYFDRNKNQAMSLRALGLMRKAGKTNVQLTLVGREAEANALVALQRLADEEGISAQLTFAGFVSDVDVYYAACDCVLLTSRAEGLPISVLEAMRAGRAVVATPVLGIEELLEHARTGWILPGWEPGSLAAALERWIADRAELARFGKAARGRFLDQFRVEKQAAELAAALDRRGPVPLFP